VLMDGRGLKSKSESGGMKVLKFGEKLYEELEKELKINYLQILFKKMIVKPSYITYKI